MKKRLCLIVVGAFLASACFAWSPGHAIAAKEDMTKAVKARVDKTTVPKAQAPKARSTRDEVYKKLGKVPPSEQKAAAKRARQQGLKPGMAGNVAPATTPAPAR